MLHDFMLYTEAKTGLRDTNNQMKKTILLVIYFILLFWGVITVLIV